MATIKMDQKLQEGRLIARENRFVAQVKLDEQEIRAYVPNPGRMEELMVPGTRCFLAHYPGGDRKTKYDLLLMEYQDRLVSINSHLPNKLVNKALQEKEIVSFKDYDQIKPEYSYGNSRLDFFLHNKVEKALIEVKSATLVEDRIAKFPDAPTKRGRRHLDELMLAKEEGYRAAVIFIIQRDDARKFTPNQRIDLKFADKLKEAAANGVEIYAYNCNVTLEGISLKEQVEVVL